MNKDSKLAAGAFGALGALLVLLLIAATQVVPGKRIKDYPHTNRAPDEAVFIMEHTNRAGPGPTATNLHISALELFQQGSNGLASTGFVNQVGTIVSNGAVNFTVNYVTNTSNSLITTISNATNIVLTSSVRVATNDSMMVLGSTPVSGSQWYVGTNGTPATNGERSGFEFHAGLRALRMGYSGDVQWNDTNTGHGSVNFGFSNIAGGRFTSITGGRNNRTHTNVENAFIGGGINHTVSTNSTNIVIGGGENHFIALDCGQSTIGGGLSHIIRRAAMWATIGGGQQNIVTDPHGTIAGGLNNFISDEIGGNPINSAVATIGGGEESIARGLRVTIGGGYKHNMLSDCDYSTISGGSSNGMGAVGGAGSGTQFAVMGGGSQNGIGSGSTYAAIASGQLNAIGANCSNSVISGGAFHAISLNSKFSSVQGGERNAVSASYGFALGTSNNVTAARAGAIGVSVTNATAGSVTVGELISYNTPAVIAGAGTGSTNYTLQLTSPEMVLGSSNVNIVASMGWIDGKTHSTSVSITNDSPDNWGLSFSAVSNRVFWSGVHGTNPPTLTNDTRLILNIKQTGSNVWVTYNSFRPAK